MTTATWMTEVVIVATDIDRAQGGGVRKIGKMKRQEPPLKTLDFEDRRDDDDGETILPRPEALNGLIMKLMPTFSRWSSRMRSPPAPVGCS